MGFFEKRFGGELRFGPAHFLDGDSLLTFTTTEVMKASAADFTSFGHFDLSDLWAVQWENTLDAFSIGDLADSEGFVDAATFAGNDDACKELNTFFITFDNAGVNFDGVAYIEGCNVFLELFGVDFVDGIHSNRDLEVGLTEQFP